MEPIMKKIIALIVVILTIPAQLTFAWIPGKTPARIAGTPAVTWFDINTISTVFRNNGITDIDSALQNSGFVYPKGTNKTAMFQSGFLWGGIINGQVRVGGSAYTTGLAPGKILSPGVSESSDLPKNRIYRVRPDYLTADLSSELHDQNLSADQIRAQYAVDWNEWPWQDGAPFYDKNGDGVYEPDSGDVPGVKDAHQTIWYVVNDLNPALTNSLYGSNPIGIEMQVTVWGYNQSGAMGEALFHRYVLINKGAAPTGADTIRNMYVSQWADPDIGNSTDDFAGCDTTLGLGYGYNATASDAGYLPLPPPAAGFELLKGPSVPSPGDTALIFGRKVPGRKNLPMNAFF
jgi:hypothetical protein